MTLPAGNAREGLGEHPRRARHRLHPAGDDDLGVTGLDGAGGDHGGVEARAAQPIDRRRGHADRQAGEQHGHPADVAVVLPGPVGVAPHDLVDLTVVEAGSAVEHPGQGDGGQVVGAHIGERTAEAAERRTGRGVEIGLGHASAASPWSGSWSGSSARTSWAIRKAVLASGTPQ